MKISPKGHRLNPDDETIREIITDIRAPTEGGISGVKALQGLTTRQPVSDGDHQDRKKCPGVGIAAL